MGFKLCWNRNEAVFYAAVAGEIRRIRKIVLEAREIGSRASSRCYWRRQTGEWVIYDDAAARGARPKVHVDEEELLRHIAFNDAYYAENRIGIARSSSFRPSRGMYCMRMRICFQGRVCGTLWFLGVGRAQSGAAGGSDLEAKFHIVTGSGWRASDSLEEVSARHASRRGTLLRRVLMKVALLQEERYRPSFHGSNNKAIRCLLLESLAREGARMLTWRCVRRRSARGAFI